MPVRKSVVIGCGTAGAEIAAKVSHNFKKHCEETGQDRNRVQFLLIDTQDPTPGAEELYNRGDHLMIGVRHATEVRDALRENDPFFQVWWPEKYTDIPRLFPGAGTIPINGRMAFWSKLGDTNQPGSFVENFQEKVMTTSKFKGM